MLEAEPVLLNNGFDGDDLIEGRKYKEFGFCFKNINKYKTF